MKDEIEKLMQEKKTLSSNLTSINQRIQKLKQEIKRAKPRALTFKERTSGNVQSRVYIPKGYRTGELMDGISCSDYGFPQEEGKLKLRQLDESDFYGIFNKSKLDSLSNCIKRKSDSGCWFDHIFDLYDPKIYYFDRVVIGGTLRIGEAVTYHSSKRERYRTIHHEGATLGSWGDEWYKEPWDEKVLVPDEYEYDWKKNERKVPIAILSARTSLDLDTLEEKLGFAGGRK